MGHHFISGTDAPCVSQPVQMLDVTPAIIPHLRQIYKWREERRQGGESKWEGRWKWERKVGREMGGRGHENYSERQSGSAVHPQKHPAGITNPTDWHATFIIYSSEHDRHFWDIFMLKFASRCHLHVFPSQMVPIIIKTFNIRCGSWPVWQACGCFFWLRPYRRCACSSSTSAAFPAAAAAGWHTRSRLSAQCSPAPEPTSLCPSVWWSPPVATGGSRRIQQT